MHVHIVAGGQFGSEGKGAFTAALVTELSKTTGAPALVRVAGPNAGHTAYDAQWRKWSLRQIPVGAVVNLESPVILGQQSEIDIDVLLDEITQLEDAEIPIRERLFVDEAATVITDDHKAAESSITTGSTKKGIGAARADRLMRSALLMRDYDSFKTCHTPTILRQILRHNGHVVIEGTQGYGLGLHTGYYPHCTSSNTRPGDFLAMTGLQPWECPRLIPWLVFRAHPIRIAGNSGPLQNETTWEEVGQPTEYTTVTKLPRRVGEWDFGLASEALIAAGGHHRVRVAFTFADYLVPELANVTEPSDLVRDFAKGHGQSFGEQPAQIYYIGTGPMTGVWRPGLGWDA